MSRTPTGAQRAFTTIILLTLHRKGEISDGGGAAVHQILVKAGGLYTPVVPGALNTAMRKLRSEGVVLTDTGSNATYSVRLARKLSKETIAALEAEEGWARAFIKKEPLPNLTCPPPPIEFAEDRPEASNSVKTTDLDSLTIEPVAASGSSPVSADVSVLMQIITEQAGIIRALRAELNLPVENNRLSSEVTEFLMNFISS